jgi:hypothetical protein
MRGKPWAHPMIKTTFKPTTIQFLYRREPIGVYYARLYVRGGNKWISLHTKVFSVAKLELHKHLSRNFVLQDARAAARSAKQLLATWRRFTWRASNLTARLKHHRRSIGEKRSNIFSARGRN